MRRMNYFGFAVSAAGLLTVGSAWGQPGPGPQDQGDPRGPGREERRARMFDELDTNHDGQISRDEFNARRAFRRGEGPGPGGPGGPATRPAGGGQPRGPLAGPQGDEPGPGGPGPQGGGEPPRQNRRGGPMFGMMDSNHDGKLQPSEIQRVLDIFNKALKASQEEDLTAEDWTDLAAELRPPGGFGGNRPPNGPDGNSPPPGPRGTRPKNPPPQQ